MPLHNPRRRPILREALARIVRDAEQVSIGDDISIRLTCGELGATVETKT